MTRLGISRSATGRMMVYRVQCEDGRGPWRPGFSRHWIDGDAPEGRLSETVMDLIPVEEILALPMSHHYGCGCRSLPDLMLWFTPLERYRLKVLGFYPVRILADHVVRESEWQVFFARQRPLWDGATRLSWP